MDSVSSSSTVDKLNVVSSTTNSNASVPYYSPDNIRSWTDLVFHNLESIKAFYYDYAHEMGFVVRCMLKSFYNSAKVKKDKVQYVCYCCNKQGFKKGIQYDPKNNTPADSPIFIQVEKEKEQTEARMGCEAVICLKYDEKVNGYKIYKWIGEHNHRLHNAEHSHYLRSARKISEPQKQIALINSKSGMSMKSSFQVMRQMDGGSKNLKFCFSDLKNFLSTVRPKEMVIGDATIIQEYLRTEVSRNPLFYYDIQVDAEENIASIFWSDCIMQMDYELFGDVLSFHTTYCTNRAYRPLGTMLGFDNHHKSVLFGAALLYDETTETFYWLFSTFLKCMKNKKPFTIFTYQAHALLKPVPNIFPDSFHGLCSWHMGKNAMSNLRYRATTTFFNELNHLVSNVDDVGEFDFNWSKMLQNCFGGQPASDFTWLVQIFDNREQWSSPWVKSHFTAGLKTTQLSESFNAFLKNFLQPDHSLVQFFSHFNVMVERMQDNHAYLDFKAANTRPKNNYPNNQLMRSVLNKYTPYSFAFVHKYYDLSFKYFYEEDLSTSSISMRVFKVFTIEVVHNPDDLDEDFDVYLNVDQNLEEVQTNFVPSDEEPLHLDERIVSIDVGNKIYTCTCRMFENRGFSCLHIFKILDFLGSSVQYQSLKTIPNHYILRRWTKGIRTSIVRLAPNIIGGIEDSTFAQRYQIISGVILQFETRVCVDNGAFQVFLNGVLECGKQVEEFLAINGVASCPLSSLSTSVKDTSVVQSSLVVTSSAPKFKVRPNPIRSKKRLKSDYEKAKQREKFVALRKKQKSQHNAAGCSLPDTCVD